MIPAIYASAMMRRGGDIACGIETEYGGGEAFPSEFSVTLGSGLGAVFLEYAVGARPDKIEVWVSGAKVLDTGYVGDVSFQADLDSALAARGLPSEPIRQRVGAGTTTGDFSDVKTREYAAYYKSTTSAQAIVRVYAPLDGTAWRIKLNCPDGYHYQIFDESGTFVVPDHVAAVDALLVAGGGGGGHGYANASQPGGGGGAGGLLISSSVSVTPRASISVTVGAGGAGGIGSSLTPPNSGANSVFSGLTAIGGGRAAVFTGSPAEQGGSGGGGTTSTPGAAGTPGQGNNGGQGTTNIPPYSTGGGGGSKTAGGSGTTITGSAPGGDGHALGELGWGGAIAFGAPKAVAGGGGGGNRSNGSRSANPGGFGGGGDSGLIGGTDAQKSGQSGINGTGSGGGGPANSGSAPAANGGDGGDGLVIIRYPAIPGL